MKKIAVGVVGLGFGLHVHVPALRRLEEYEVVAICGHDVARARAAADASGIVRAFGDWRLMLQDGGIDAITVAVPPAVQPSIAAEALAQGKAVFCEKPLGATVESIEPLVAAAARTALPNMIDFEFTATQPFERAKSLVDQSFIGRLHHVTVTWHVETYAHRLNTGSWKRQAAIGGGALNGFGSHVLHYLEWFFGPIERLLCTLGGANAPEFTGDSEVRLLAEFTGGGAATVCIASNSFLGSGHRIEMYGDEGTVVLSNGGRDYVDGFRLLSARRPADRLTEAAGSAAPVGTDGRITAVAILLRRFGDWVRTGQPAGPAFEAGVRVQQLLASARRSSEAETWVHV